MTREGLKKLDRIRKIVVAVLALLWAAVSLIGIAALFQNIFWGFAWLLIVLFAGLPVCLLLTFLFRSICSILAYRMDPRLVSATVLAIDLITVFLALLALVFGWVFVSVPSGGWTAVVPLAAFMGMIILKLIRVVMNVRKK